MIQCIAIDDEPLALQVIEAFCDKTPFLDLKKSFTRTSEALMYLKKFPVDLLFLDIHMPDLSGIDFYKSLQSNKMAIFTTAHSQYAVTGFDLQAIDYLLKPISYNRFLQAAEKARQFYNMASNNIRSEEAYINVRSEYKLVRILLNDILYIEGLDDYVRIHLTKGKPIMTRMSMKSMMERLPNQHFVRVHRSFIIPINLAITLKSRKLYLEDNTEIPIGTSYLDKIQNIFKTQ